MSFKENQIRAFGKNIDFLGEPITYIPADGSPQYCVKAVINELVEITPYNTQIPARQEQVAQTFDFVYPCTANRPKWNDVIVTEDGLKWSVITISKAYGRLVTLSAAQNTNEVIGNDHIEDK